MDLLVAIESVPVWIWLTTGVVLVAFDVFASSTVFLGCIGVSFLIIGLLDALGLSGFVQVLALPIVFPLLAWQAPRLMKHHMMDHDVVPDVEEMIGMTGTVIDQPSCSDMNRAHFAGCGDWQVRYTENLKPGDRVQVIGREGLELLVERV
jgi:membrane protein implicated in regulation of membrane protease activity